MRQRPCAEASFCCRAGNRIARLTRERDEAVEQEAATAEILRVSSSTPGDFPSVCKASWRTQFVYVMPSGEKSIAGTAS